MAPPASLRRRTLLTGAAGAMVATSGCIGEFQNIFGRQRTQQLSLTVSTLPADDDPYAIRIANELVDNLLASGVDARVDPVAPDTLLREVLINKDFDIYVTRYPSDGHPEILWELLYSPYGEESGWQNPFGFSSPGIDDLLESYRVEDPETRRGTIDELQESMLFEQPFTVVAFPDGVTGHRTDRFTGWGDGLVDSASYFGLEPVNDAETLRVAVRDPRITRNWNPIAAEHRDRGILSGLLYEPLVRQLDGQQTPWLARNIEWSTNGELSASIELRDATWHDGEPVTVEDVVFTYRFFRDTSLGGLDSPVPAPLHRARVSLVDSVHTTGDNRVVLTFGANDESLAARALEIPILPEHEWEERTESADVAGIDLIGGTTEALVTTNEEPVGSGPLEFAESTDGERLVLERFDDHFLHRDEPSELPEPYASGVEFTELAFQIVPSWDAAAELLLNDEADAMSGSVNTAIIPRLVRDANLDVAISRSSAFYHIGYNCRRDPLTNFRFRRVLGQLIDREYLVSDAFNSYAIAGESPLEGTEWMAEDLEWDGEGTLPFVGEDGDLDIDDAREAFSEAGYQYEDGQLIRRGDT